MSICPLPTSLISATTKVGPADQKDISRVSNKLDVKISIQYPLHLLLPQISQKPSSQRCPGYQVQVSPATPALPPQPCHLWPATTPRNQFPSPCSQSRVIHQWTSAYPSVCWYRSLYMNKWILLINAPIIASVVQTKKSYGLNRDSMVLYIRAQCMVRLETKDKWLQGSLLANMNKCNIAHGT